MLVFGNTVVTVFAFTDCEDIVVTGYAYLDTAVAEGFIRKQTATIREQADKKSVNLQVIFSREVFVQFFDEVVEKYIQ